MRILHNPVIKLHNILSKSPCRGSSPLLTHGPAAAWNRACCDLTCENNSSAAPESEVGNAIYRCGRGTGGEFSPSKAAGAMWPGAGSSGRTLGRCGRTPLRERTEPVKRTRTMTTAERIEMAGDESSGTKPAPWMDAVRDRARPSLGSPGHGMRAPWATTRRPAQAVRLPGANPHGGLARCLARTWRGAAAAALVAFSVLAGTPAPVSAQEITTFFDRVREGSASRLRRCKLRP